MTGGAMLRDFSRGDETPLREINRRYGLGPRTENVIPRSRYDIFSVGYTQFGKPNCGVIRIPKGIRNVAKQGIYQNIDAKSSSSASTISIIEPLHSG